jgi:hypothetical protein
MYWLAVDSKERADRESWVVYSHRSCAEVLNKFQHLVCATDFEKEASGWPSVLIDPTKNPFIMVATSLAVLVLHHHRRGGGLFHGLFLVIDRVQAATEIRNEYWETNNSRSNPTSCPGNHDVMAK